MGVVLCFVSYFHSWGTPRLVMRKLQECWTFPVWGAGPATSKVPSSAAWVHSDSSFHLVPPPHPSSWLLVFFTPAKRREVAWPQWVSHRKRLPWKGFVHANFVESLASGSTRMRVECVWEWWGWSWLIQCNMYSGCFHKTWPHLFQPSGHPYSGGHFWLGGYKNNSLNY